MFQTSGPLQFHEIKAWPGSCQTQSFKEAAKEAWMHQETSAQQCTRLTIPADARGDKVVKVLGVAKHDMSTLVEVESLRSSIGPSGSTSCLCRLEHDPFDEDDEVLTSGNVSTCTPD
jgi:hypothetical protein